MKDKEKEELVELFKKLGSDDQDEILAEILIARLAELHDELLH